MLFSDYASSIVWWRNEPLKFGKLEGKQIFQVRNYRSGFLEGMLQVIQYADNRHKEYLQRARKKRITTQ